MSRPASRLSESVFDLVVVGGGIHGLFAALGVASQGHSVALFERGDYGGGLSSNHQRTVHGGLRALQSGQLTKTRRQIAERRAWAIMAPHLVRPLPFVLPTCRGVVRSRLAIGAALRVYDWLGRDRNAGLPEALHLPASRIESLAETTRRFPGLVPGNVTGGALWYDYQVRHPDRLNWLVAAAALRAGAQLFNYAEVTALRRDSGGVGIGVDDLLSARHVEVPARRVLICAGGGAPLLHARLGLAPSPLLVRASSLLIDRPALDRALAARARSGRMLTATPWSGYWLVGTFQEDQPADPGAAPYPSSAAVDAMIAEANSAFPALHVHRRDVRLVHSGLTPAVVRRGRAELMPDSSIVDHTATLHAAVFSVIGVKFTTARATALEALRRMALGAPVDRLPVLLPHATAEGADAALRAAAGRAGIALDPDIAEHLVDWYGTEAADVLAESAAADLVRRLAPGVPVIEGEVVYAAARSHAVRLADVVLRRTNLGAAGHPGDAALGRAADLLAHRLGWSAERRAAEIASVEARYDVGPS